MEEYNAFPNEDPVEASKPLGPPPTTHTPVVTEHQLRVEHQTGLILELPTNTNAHANDAPVITQNTLTLPHEIVKALRALRDSNPSLQRKLNHSNHGTLTNATTNAATNDDECIEYWNRYQNIVVMEDDSWTGLNLGGLMLRIIDFVPFMKSLDEDGIALAMINLGGTDVPMKNLLQSIMQESSSTLASLTSLYLGGCGIASRKGVDDLIQVLEACPNVNTLDLRYNDFTGDDMMKLEPVLSSSNVQILHLEGNMMKCNGAAAVGKLLSHTKSLKELYLGGNGIAANGAKDLANGLDTNASVKKLYLEGNFIGDEGADSLRMVVLDQTERNCKVLKHLYVENNGIGQDAATLLGRAVNSAGLIDGSLF